MKVRINRAASASKPDRLTYNVDEKEKFVLLMKYHILIC